MLYLLHPHLFLHWDKKASIWKWSKCWESCLKYTKKLCSFYFKIVCVQLEANPWYWFFILRPHQLTINTARISSSNSACRGTSSSGSLCFYITWHLYIWALTVLSIQSTIHWDLDFKAFSQVILQAPFIVLSAHVNICNSILQESSSKIDYGEWQRCTIQSSFAFCVKCE